MHSDVCALDSLLACIPLFCTHIKNLEMRFCSLNTSFFEVMSGLQSLRFLRITFCTNVSTTSDRIQYRSVSSLHLDRKLSTQTQRGLLSMCPNLKVLHVFHTEDVDLSTLPSTVERLNIFQCARIVAWNLNESVNNIRVVRSGLRDEHIDEIITLCPNIHYLDVGHNILISEAAIVSICDTYKDKLHGFKVAGCDSFSFAGLNLAISMCRNLRHLDISRLRKTTVQDTVFTAIAQNCPALRYLATHGNALSDSTLLVISRMRLEWLMMIQTGGYSERGIMSLVTGCAQLRYIAIDHYLVTINQLVKLMWQDKRPSLKFL